ncbi:hypothetical protein G7051_17655 [Dysgonomonas sp. HDW5B]|uniref:hypothetical protein n=1 Tax=Dysgonomonas sp. HDW5B TaxID=2714927 RepID=UPI0014073BAA|nr:hypothetical protein [Dysgonomonas sp. HDW5B]QIK56087.1 hypothetical protein G7051_17655 [Dysgonomonas sp. HDW5B]
MKIYVLIILFFIGTGCRSSRNTTDTHISDHSKESKKEVSSETISLQSSMLTITRTATDTNIKEYFRTTLFNPDGSVSQVQEQWRGTRQNELSDSSGRSSNISLINRNDSTSTEIDTDIEVKQTTQSHTDSRPVQGIEWLYVACVGGIVILIIIIFAWPKKKK